MVNLCLLRNMPNLSSYSDREGTWPFMHVLPPFKLGKLPQDNMMTRFIRSGDGQTPDFVHVLVVSLP